MTPQIPEELVDNNELRADAKRQPALVVNEAPTGLRPSGFDQAHWTWEEHQLSEGFSCIVYDEHGYAIADHLDRETAAKIAAAPELLKALEGVLKCIELAGQCLGDMDAMRAAIAKARGQ